MLAAGEPRLLVIMGSGETSPTMGKVHRDLFERLGGVPRALARTSGPAPDTAPGGKGAPPRRGGRAGGVPARESSRVPAVVLDTPVGFQENADDVAGRAVAYFRETVRRDVAVASYRATEQIGSLAYETMLNRLREARYVFAGPGSPSYALAQWRDSQVPDVLAEKLRSGGCLTFASAAAVTLGPLALPVYEIYKVGAPPHWVEGLNLMAEAGLPAAVIPHYDNAEGGTHDTRYCYMGERRLRHLENMLPDGTFVLGVDEHTACVLDLGAETVTVSGRGAVTVRSSGRSTRVEAGTTVTLAELRHLARADPARGTRADPPARPEPEPPTAKPTPFLADVDRLREEFDAGLAGERARAAAEAALGLEELLVNWSHDTLQSDERDRARAALRSMVARLGELAEEGVRDPRALLAPAAVLLVEVRERARADGRWADADVIRAALAAAGIELHDTPAGTTWEMRPGDGPVPLVS